MSAVDRPLVSPVLVGREPLLAAVADLVAHAAAGRGGTLLVAGEAGAGKSRLIAEVVARAAATGVAALHGAGFEPDRLLPHAPLRALLREAAADARPRDEREPVWTPDDWVARLLGVTAGRPCLVVVEDVHWADDASLDVLLRLARSVRRQPVLLVLSYRSDEPTPGLSHLLAELDRSRLADEAHVGPLAPPEIDRMLRAIFAQSVPIRADFLAAIADLTDGNPFFIEEVVRSLVASGGIFLAEGRWERRRLAELRIPRSVREAVLRRSHQLGSEAVALARVAAVAGRAFDWPVVAAVTGHDDATLLRLVRELVAAGLVVEESVERFAFRHALTRQAIAGEMLGQERRAVHRALAAALATVHAADLDPVRPDLARHAFGGEDWPAALEHGERAGRQALAMFAPQAAAEHFTMALTAAAALGQPPPIRLLRERGRAHAILGEFDAARADGEAVLAAAVEAGDVRAEQAALVALGALWEGHDYTRAEACLERAVALARKSGDQPALADSLVRLGACQLNTERPDLAEASLFEAQAIQEATGDRHGAARTLDWSNATRTPLLASGRWATGRRSRRPSPP